MWVPPFQNEFSCENLLNGKEWFPMKNRFDRDAIDNSETSDSFRIFFAVQH